MTMTMFSAYFLEIAASETRTITLFDHPDLPHGEYGLLELYCDEPHCDCRRVIFYVVSAPPALEHWATINYGWESAEFYADWLDDPELGAQAAGPTLEPLGPQSRYAEQWLDIIERVLMDDEYVRRLQRHYTMFKEAVEAQAAATLNRRRGRRGPTKRK